MKRYKGGEKFWMKDRPSLGCMKHGSCAVKKGQRSKKQTTVKITAGRENTSPAWKKNYRMNENWK